MFWSKFILASVALVSVASAQDPIARVAFTSVPAVVVGGETYNITWGGGDGSTVTITLRKGEPSSLDTIGVLADNIEGSSYNWTVSRTLDPADDYALQITQGQDEINYSGLFSVVEGDSSSSSTITADASATTSRSSNSSVATTTIGLTGNSTRTGNSTTSTSSVPRTITTVPPTSARTPSASSATPVETSAPSTDSAARVVSSVVLITGIVAAMMLLS